MVECESVLKIRGVLWAVVLIDTWWNVNSELVSQLEYIHEGFNRYMVECESL